MNLKEYMKANKLTIDEAAIQLGLRPSVLAMIVDGVTCPDLRRAEQIVAWSGGKVSDVEMGVDFAPLRSLRAAYADGTIRTAEIASACGVSRQSVHAWCKAISYPGPAHMRELEKLFCTF